MKIITLELKQGGTRNVIKYIFKNSYSKILHKAKQKKEI